MMRSSALLLGFGALLVAGVVLSQIELSFVQRSPTIPTTSAPSSEALELAELRSKELEGQLTSLQLEHTERIARLEQRLANFVQSEQAVIRPAVPPARSELGHPPSQTPPLSIPRQAHALPPAAPVAAAPPPPKQVPPKLPPPKPLLPLPPTLPPKPPASASREERAAHNKAAAELKKAAELAVLQAEVDGDVAAFNARGWDASRRLALLHLPLDPPLPVSSADAFGAPRHWGGLRDLLLDTKAKLAVCPIEKVASSELKKLLLRMTSDARWRDEPWFKGGIHKIKFEKDVETVLHIVNRPEWTKAVFLRHPFERLVSCYKDKFGRENRLYSVKMSGNRSTHILSFEEFVRLVAGPGSAHQNAHWRPQSRFCGLQKYKSKFNFIGNFENLTSHVEVLLRGTDLWDSFGAHGWPWRDKQSGATHRNGSMFGGNAAAHCTSCGAVASQLANHGGNGARLSFDPGKTAQTYDELLPPGSELRRLAFDYYKADFELFAAIDTPPWNNARYKADLANKGG